DGVHVVVDDPDVLLRIVGVDGDVMRALENFVPLGPGFDDVAVGIHDGEAMLPFSVHADSALPELGAIVGILPGAAGARQRRYSGVAPGEASDGELQAGGDFGELPSGGPLDVGKLAAEQQKYPVG